jgi:tetratricopeptide (TPR) repeat protein
MSARSGDILASAARPSVGRDNLIEVLDTLARTLRAGAGDRLEVIRAEPTLLALTSTSLEAMVDYAAALRSPDDDAVALLRRAVTLDTSFAAALWQLARRSRPTRRSDADERRNLMARAWAHRGGLTEYERLRVEIEYLYGSDGKTPDRTQFVDRLWQVVEMYPNAGDAVLLADSYRGLQRLAEAERAYRLAIVLDSSDAKAYLGLVSTLLAKGQIHAARSTLTALEPRFPDLGWWDAHVSYAEGRRDRERAILQDKARDVLSPSGALAYRTLALLDILEGRVADWQRDNQSAMSLDSATGRLPPPFKFDALGTNYWIRDRRAEGLEQLDAELAANRAARRSPVAAVLYAQFGSAGKARVVLAASDSATSGGRAYGAQRSVAMGWILLAEDNPLDAIAEFRRSAAAADGPTAFSPIALDPAIGFAFERAGFPDSAIVAYEHFLNTPESNRLLDDAKSLPWVLEHIAPLYEKAGKRKEAGAAYARFVDLWKNADPELQLKVTRAAQAFAALSGANR